MTQDFGEFASINVEETVKRAQQQAAKVVEIQDKLTSAAGHGESPDGYVKVTYTSAEGISELEINPRAMRMPSVDLAEAIKQAIKDASTDLQANIHAMMAEIYQGQDDNPLEMMKDPAKMVAKIKEVQEHLNGAVGDASLYMEKLRRRMEQ